MENKKRVNEDIVDVENIKNDDEVFSTSQEI